jgi:signal transduction histidine kinase
MLENLAGPARVADGLVIAAQALRRGLQADEVALLTRPDGEGPRWRAFAGPLGTGPAEASHALRGAAENALAETYPDGRNPRQLTVAQGRRARLVPFTAANGPAVLVASWKQPSAKAAQEEIALMEDAAHSLQLALDREEAGLAHQEAAALRRSGELQRGFLSRLSHELRTPLTAIRGYASSLMQTDVTWDRSSQDRFLDRIAAESARLGRLVDDLLDFSTIESGLMRLQPDWCDLPLVVQAAVACLPPSGRSAVAVHCDPGLPVIWADHDRLEQVFVNLINNAVGHNPPGTRVWVTAEAAGAEVMISVSDDGTGIPDDLAAAPFEAGRRRRTRTGGAGLGLSIAQGIVDAHHGRIELQRLDKGTRFRVYLPADAQEDTGDTGAGALALVPGGAPPGMTKSEEEHNA